MPSFAARCACFSPMGYGITPMSTIVEATPPLLSRLKFLASNLAKTHPRLFLTIARHRENHVRKLVDENTDVVIEGYMRCGNYFAVYAFEHAQPGRVRIAHHFHAPAQLMVAARLGVPSILLLRHPRDAVLSALVYYSRWLTPPFARTRFFTKVCCAIARLSCPARSTRQRARFTR